MRYKRRKNNLTLIDAISSSLNKTAEAELSSRDVATLSGVLGGGSALGVLGRKKGPLSPLFNIVDNALATRELNKAILDAVEKPGNTYMRGLREPGQYKKWVKEKPQWRVIKAVDELGKINKTDRSLFRKALYNWKRVLSPKQKKRILRALGIAGLAIPASAGIGYGIGKLLNKGKEGEETDLINYPAAGAVAGGVGAGLLGAMAHSRITEPGLYDSIVPKLTKRYPALARYGLGAALGSATGYGAYRLSKYLKNRS